MLIYDLVDPVEMTGAARAAYREVPDTDQFTLNEVLPDVEVQDTHWEAAVGTVTHGEAKFRNFDTPTPVGKRRAELTTKRGVFPPIGQKLIVGEYERIMLEVAKGMQLGEIVSQSYRDTHSNVVAIRTRIERARAQVLLTGAFTLTDENGLSMEADYEVPGDHFVAPGTLWTNPAADLFGDLEAWFTKYQDDDPEGQLPGRITTSRRVINLARKNQQVIRAVFGPLASEGRVSPTQLNEVLIDEGFPAFVAYEAKVGGQRLIPDDKLILTPANARDLGETQFGITVDALELVNSNQVDMALKDAPGITAVQLKNDDPAQILNKATAASIPVLRNSNRIIVADVA